MSATANTGLKSVAASAGSSIETDFPIEELAPVAELESYRKEVYRPVYHIHKWWANRLGSVFRTILLTALRPSFKWSDFYDSQQLSDSPIILDPFMGSGTTLGEAVKLGCRVVGCDINPISALQVRKALEPTRLLDLKEAFSRLESRVAGRIAAHYKTVSVRTGQPADVLYTFWVMTAACQSCASATRLFGSYAFAGHAYPGRSPTVQVLCPSCGHVFPGVHGSRSATCPLCSNAFDPGAGAVRGSRFVCQGCRKETSVGAAVRAQGGPRYRMYATLVLDSSGDKYYQAATDLDLVTYANAERELVNASLRSPVGEISPGHNTQQILNYGVARWRDLFNARQLLCLGTLVDGILAEQDSSMREFMLLLFSGTLEFNNMLCSYKGEGTGAVRHAFSHHVLRPHRTPLEAHVWGTPKSSGSFSTLFESRLLRAKRYCEHPFELRRTSDGRGEKVFLPGVRVAPQLAKDFCDLQDGRAQALVLCGDSANLPLPDQSVDAVVTDPPYFDNVNYSELADLFYSWLHPELGSTDESTSTRHPREVQSQDADRFGVLLGDVLSESVRALKPSGLVVFTFHHSKPEAWCGVATALRRAGLVATKTHAIKAEMSVAQPKQLAREPIDIDCVIVATRRTELKGSEEDPLSSAVLSIDRLNHAGFQLSRGDVKVILAGEALRQHGRRETERFEAILQQLWAATEQLHGSQRHPETVGASNGAPRLF